MAVRKPVVLYDGLMEEMRPGDTISDGECIKVQTYDVITGADGAWSIDYSADFTSVVAVVPVGIANGTAMQGQIIATLASWDNAGASGNTVQSNQVILSLNTNGWKLGDSADTVKVTVFGT